MRIIKMGKPPENIEKVIHCNKCNTIFTYMQKDLENDFRDGPYVKCPVCGQFIADIGRPVPE